MRRREAAESRARARLVRACAPAAVCTRVRSRIDAWVCVVFTGVPGLPAAKAGLVVGQGRSAVRMEEFEH